MDDGDTTGVEFVRAHPLDLKVCRYGDEQAERLVGPAPLADLAQPVPGLVEPVSLAAEDGEIVAEVVGADADDDEPGLHPVSVFAQGVIILLRRVADVARIDDGHRQLPGGFEVALKLEW